MFAESTPSGGPALEQSPEQCTAGADGSTGQPVGYAHATAPALARGDGLGSYRRRVGQTAPTTTGPASYA